MEKNHNYLQTLSTLLNNEYNAHHKMFDTIREITWSYQKALGLEYKEGFLHDEIKEIDELHEKLSQLLNRIEQKVITKEFEL